MFKITLMPKILNNMVDVTTSSDEPSINFDFFSSVVITRHVIATMENICRWKNKLKYIIESPTSNVVMSRNAAGAKIPKSSLSPPNDNPRSAPDHSFLVQPTDDGS